MRRSGSRLEPTKNIKLTLRRRCGLANLIGKRNRPATAVLNHVAADTRMKACYRHLAAFGIRLPHRKICNQGRRIPGADYHILKCCYGLAKALCPHRMCHDFCQSR